MNNKIYLSTTQIPVMKTQGEIQSLLVQAGAIHVVSEYSPAGDAIAMHFTMKINGCDRPVEYRLPVRCERVYQSLLSIWKAKKRRANKPTNQFAEQSKRIAWRQILMWLKAQLAMMELGQSSPFETFLPYMMGTRTQTLAELMAIEKKVPLLPEKVEA